MGQPAPVADAPIAARSMPRCSHDGWDLRNSPASHGGVGPQARPVGHLRRRNHDPCGDVSGACRMQFNPRVQDRRPGFPLAWPCDRLIVEWTVNAGRLQRMVGESPRVRRIDGAGRLQLHVTHCEPPSPSRRESDALAYAYVLVPVSGDSAPVRITRIASDGWFSLLRAVASENSQALFEDFHLDVVAAAQDFMIDEADDEPSISVQLTFDNGHISIDANTIGQSTTHAASTAFLGSGDGFDFAYFGEEASLRYPAFAAVRVVGETPLSPFDLSATPAAATFDRGLVSDRVYWRVPATPEPTTPCTNGIARRRGLVSLPRGSNSSTRACR